MGELHTGTKHPLNVAEPESDFDLHVVPPGYLPRGDVECGYVAQYDHIYSGRVGLISVSQLPI